jgi:hypothetical protein
LNVWIYYMSMNENAKCQLGNIHEVLGSILIDNIVNTKKSQLNTYTYLLTSSQSLSFDSCNWKNLGRRGKPIICHVCKIIFLLKLLIIKIGGILQPHNYISKIFVSLVSNEIFHRSYLVRRILVGETSHQCDGWWKGYL